MILVTMDITNGITKKALCKNSLQLNQNKIKKRSNKLHLAYESSNFCYINLNERFLQVVNK